MSTKQQEKYREMTESAIAPLIIRLAIPCIVSMLVTAFYNMADTFFVGMLDNNSATGAVGVVFSMMAMIQAVGFCFGQGSGILISNELGKQNYEEASRLVATGFFMALLFGGVICVGGLLVLEPLTLLLGATETILPYAKEYLGVILLGTPWITSSFVLNNQLRYQGNAAYAMVGITIGSVLNIILDPIMIFTFNMGVAGAAWATIISQFVSFCLLLLGTNRGSNLRVRIRDTRFSAPYLKRIILTGTPALARQSLASISTICLNLAAKPYGDVAIAAMSIVQRIMMFASSAMLGFGQGFQPFCGFNYGAQKYRRVIRGFWFSVKVATAFLLIMGIIGFTAAPQLIGLFRDDPAVIACGVVALRAQCLFLFSNSVLVITSMMQQTMGRTIPATGLSVARQGLFFIPMVLILPHILGLLGVQIAQAVADVLAVICAFLVQRKTLKELSAEADRLSQ